jgi:hypothetical protein
VSETKFEISLFLIVSKVSSVEVFVKAPFRAATFSEEVPDTTASRARAEKLGHIHAAENTTV